VLDVEFKQFSGSTIFDEMLGAFAISDRHEAEVPIGAASAALGAMHAFGATHEEMKAIAAADPGQLVAILVELASRKGIELSPQG
jgi:hypothetical protein